MWPAPALQKSKQRLLFQAPASVPSGSTTDARLSQASTNTITREHHMPSMNFRCEQGGTWNVLNVYNPGQELEQIN